MASEAQRAANKRYRAKQREAGKTQRGLTIIFKEEELWLLEHARAQENTTAYIKALIQKEAENES